MYRSPIVNVLKNVEEAEKKTISKDCRAFVVDRAHVERESAKSLSCPGGGYAPEGDCDSRPIRMP